MTGAPGAILFDMDGTILDWQTGMEESWRASCEKHAPRGISPAGLHAAIQTRRTWFWDDAERAYRGRMDLDAASREIVRHAFADLGLADRAAAHALADDYRAARALAIAPYPGAIATLEAARARGIPMALVTNGEARNQRRSIERHALAQYFRCIVIEGEFGAGKPEERVFRHALEALACAPERAWMVGDSLEVDIAVPHALGLHTIWVDTRAEGLPPGARVTPHRIVTTIAGLLDADLAPA